MSKAKPVYDAISDIKDEYINDAMQQSAPKKNGNFRYVLEAVACVVIVCGFVALSFVLRSVSGPGASGPSSGDIEQTDPGTEITEQITEADPAVVTTDTEYAAETDDIPETEEFESEQIPDTTSAETAEPSTYETDDKFFIKLYVAVYNSARGFTPYGELIAGRYTGIGRNPDRISNELPGIEALGLEELMPKNDVHGIIGKFAGSVSFTDDGLINFWDYKTDDGDTFCISAHYVEVEDKNDWAYRFDKFPLIRLKIEVIKAELKKGNLSENKKEEYEKKLSDLYTEYEEYSAEYCKAAVEFAQRLSGLEIAETNDPEYATELINTVFTSLMDYMQNKQAYTDIDADDDLRRLIYEGFILDDFCDVISKNKTATDILHKIFNMSDKIRIRNDEYRRTHEVMPYTEYDYLVNYGKNDGYSEYVRISTRYNAVFYYRETPGEDTVYYLMFKEDGGAVKGLTPDLIRKNTVSKTEFENSTGIKIEFEYDQSVVDRYLDKIYSHPLTTKMSMKLKDKVIFDEHWQAVQPDNDKSFFEYIVSEGTVYYIKAEAPYVKYCYVGYPESYVEGAEQRVTSILIAGEDIKICGININSSYEDFEKTFSELGLDVSKNGDTYTAKNDESGIRITVYDGTFEYGVQMRVMTVSISPIQRYVIYF